MTISKIEHNLYNEANTFYMMFYIIDKCNYTCEYCYNNKPRTLETINLNAALKFIVYIYKQYAYDLKIEIIGGEPTLHPGLLDFCKSLISYIPNIEIDIYTNLSQNIKFYDAFLVYANIKFTISWHFVNNDNIAIFYNKCMYLINKYKKQLNIRIMLEYHHFNTAITLFNKLLIHRDILEPSLLDFDEHGNIFINNRGSDYHYTKQQYDLYWRCAAQTDFNKKEYTITYKESNIQEYVSNTFINIYHKSFTKWLCNVGKHYLYIDVNGYVYKCIPSEYTALDKSIFNINYNIQNFQLPKTGVICLKKTCPCIWEVSKTHIF